MAVSEPSPSASLALAHWPADDRADIRETTIGSVLRHAAARAPGRAALIVGDPERAGRCQWTYAELLAASRLGA